MKKIAEIVNLKGNIAEIKVERSSMCDGCSVKQNNGKCSCSHASLLGEAKSFVSKAVCYIPVNIGDKVIIETADSNVFRNALLVFIFPVAVFLATYSVVFNFTSKESIALVSSAIAFLLSFALIGVVEKIKKKKLPDITVVEVISNQNSN